ncbi:MAG: hypothetical protein CR985_01620 [Flavobacteriales bacterium]|nr:MAG: hypothetical protein CR985_01620 [Flavobacteriales bacterium]
MHKKIEQELKSIAQSIIQMPDGSNIKNLKEKVALLHEKLSVLEFVEQYVNEAVPVPKPAEPLVKKEPAQPMTSQPSFQPEKIIPKATPPPPRQKKVIEEEKESHIFEPKFDSVRIDIKGLRKNQISSKEEFRDAISADKTASLFDDDVEEERKTINDKVFAKTLKIGLNDRIAFVNHLFNFSLSEYNRVLSQLNTFKTEAEAKFFIANQVKPDYNWEGKEEYEERFMNLIEKRFS